MLILLGAQLVDASQPAHSPTSGEVAPNELAVTQFAPPASFPAIDEVARQLGSPVANPGTSDDWLWAKHLAAEPPTVPWSLAGYRTQAAAIDSWDESPAESDAANSTLGVLAQTLSAQNVAVQGSTAPMSNQELMFQPSGGARLAEHRFSRHSRWRHWLGRRSGSDLGLAYERVMLAPVATETALGVSHIGLQLRYRRGASSPDRAEYLWARAGTGPGAESRVDMLDSVLRTELGGPRAVVISEFSMRSLDPERSPNTTGFGDMVVGGKTLIYDGQCTKLSTIFLTYLNTGPADRGLGTGHVSLEPGLLAMHQWSERTYVHGALQYRLPLGGDLSFAGDVLTSSWALSTVWQDSDTRAWIPVLEFQTHSFLFGAQTLPDGSLRRVDGTTALDIMPGSRFAFSGSSLGACELGLSGGFRCSDADWFDSRMIIQMRWLR